MTEHSIYGVFTGDASFQPGLRGIGGRPLEVVRFGGLCAITHTGSATLEIEADPVGAILEHQRVVAAINATSTLPARLGTHLPGRAAVVALLEQFEETLLGELERLAGLAQWNLSATWDIGREVARAANQPEIAALRAELAARGTVTVDDQSRVGMMIAGALEREREDLLESTLLSLRDLINESGRVPHGGDAGAFNLALLARREQRTELEEHLNNLSKTLESRVSFTLARPLPPFVFAALELIVPSAEELEGARVALELPVQTPSAAADVQRAFRRLALDRHPDRRPGDSGAEMRRLSLARDLLQAAGSGLGVRVKRAVA
jgi:Gas vesicle synthesis protein GvpL/GvpF